MTRALPGRSLVDLIIKVLKYMAIAQTNEKLQFIFFLQQGEKKRMCMI